MSLLQAAKLAARAVQSDGELCAWNTQALPSVPNAAQPWITVDGALTQTPVPILFTVDKSQPFLALLKGSVVEESTQKAIMAGVTFIPKADDVILRSDGVTKLVLKSATPVAPNGIAIIWYLVFKA